MRSTSFLVLPLLVVLLGACAAKSAGNSEAAPVEQWSGAYGGTEQPETRVIRDSAEWRELWARLGREAPRPLDLPRERAVAIFIGERRTGGYRAEITGTHVENDHLVVEYRERTPDPGRGVTQALTNPWVVAIVTAPELPVVARKLPPD